MTCKTGRKRVQEFDRTVKEFSKTIKEKSMTQW